MGSDQRRRHAAWIQRSLDGYDDVEVDAAAAAADDDGADDDDTEEEDRDDGRTNCAAGDDSMTADVGGCRLAHGEHAVPAVMWFFDALVSYRKLAS